MIDYDKADDDPIVAETRRAREGYAAQFNFDLRAIFADLQRRNEESSRGGESVATLPPRRPKDWAEAKKAG